MVFRDVLPQPRERTSLAFTEAETAGTKRSFDNRFPRATEKKRDALRSTISLADK